MEFLFQLILALTLGIIGGAISWFIPPALEDAIIRGILKLLIPIRFPLFWFLRWLDVADRPPPKQ